MSKSSHDDFGEMPFQPIDNLGSTGTASSWQRPPRPWFRDATTDLLQPTCVWTTSALNHSGWESWWRTMTAKT